MAGSQAGFALLAFAAVMAVAVGSDASGTQLRGMSGPERAEAQPPSQLPDPARPAQAGFLARQPLPSVDVTTAEAKGSLIAELAGNVSKDRLQELESALQPMYAALPKGDAGYLGHQTVRYALHRLLLQRHGWFIVGLEPSEEALPPYLKVEWVPEFLQGLLEQRLEGRGLDLREIAALAASLEDLVRSESTRRVSLVYNLLNVPPEKRLDTTQADRVLETYMMMYLDSGNFTDQGVDLDVERVIFKQEYVNWASAASWMQQIRERHQSTSGDGKLGHADVASVASELGERFGTFNDGECRELKRELTAMERVRPGRVPILDFYKRGLVSHWEFNEKIDYLRAIGALDETDAVHPTIILPNYLGSRTNCLPASSLYAVCCRNQCEDLMGHLERTIAAPTASPELISALVAALPSDTVNASRVLPDLLVQRLHQIAERHGGQVPIHGRLFAQWMHHAYPRECPFPHEGGSNPLTPDEWMREAGEGQARVSEEEVRKLLGTCATTGADGPCSADAGELESAELPWTDAEILLVDVKQLGASPIWAVVVKVSLLLLLLPLVSIYASRRSTSSECSATVDLELESEAFDDFPEKPSQEPTEGSRRWQYFKVLLGLVAVGTALELLGVLDRFSFGCTMVGGLLLNIVAPLLLRSPKKGKLCV